MDQVSKVSRDCGIEDKGRLYLTADGDAGGGAVAAVGDGKVKPSQVVCLILDSGQL